MSSVDEPSLSAAIEAWRATRAPVIAEVVDVLANLTGDPGPLADLALVDRDTAIERLQAQVGQPVDPRWSLPLLDLVRFPPAGGFRGKAARPLWQAVAELIDALADARVAPSLNELVARARQSVGHQEGVTHLDTMVVSLLGPVSARLDRVEPPEADPTWAAQLIALRRRAPPDPDALFAPIWASPDDLGRRAVLADQLQELGDPRGQHLALSLAPKPDAAQKKQAKALEKAHRKEWLGSIQPVVKAAKLTHGFAEEVTVEVGEPRVIGALADAPEWSVVRKLKLRNQSIYGDTAPEILTWLTGPRLRRLAALEFAPTELLSMADLPIRSLHLQILRNREADAIQTSPLRLEELAFEYWDGSGGTERFGELASSPLMKGLSSFEIRNCRDALSALVAFASTDLTAAFTVKRCWSDTWGFALDTERSLELKLLTTDLTAATHELAALEGLSGLREVEVKLKRGVKLADSTHADWTRILSPLAEHLSL